MPRDHIEYSQPVGDQVAYTTCYMCACRCGIKVHLRDGTLRYIEGNRDHPVNRGVLCAKGSAGIMNVLSPARLRAPLKRIGPRGSGEFAEISWDEALTIATDRLRRIRETDPNQLAFFTGRDQSQSLTGFFAQMFGTINYAAHGGFCTVNMAAAGLYSVGGAFWEFGEPDWELAKLFLLIGVAEDHDSNPIKLGLGRLKERGAKIISINPVRTGYSAIADEFVGITPGTDGLLVFGLDSLPARGWPNRSGFSRSLYQCALPGDRRARRPRSWPLRPGSRGQAACLRSAIEWLRGCRGLRHSTPLFSARFDFRMDDRRRQHSPMPPNVICRPNSRPKPWPRVAAFRPRPSGGSQREIAEVAFNQPVVLDQSWTDTAGRQHQTMVGRPVAIHAMRGISAHSNGFHTCRAIHLLQMLIGAVDTPGSWRYKSPYPKPIAGGPPPGGKSRNADGSLPAPPLGVSAWARGSVGRRAWRGAPARSCLLMGSTTRHPRLDASCDRRGPCRRPPSDRHPVHLHVQLGVELRDEPAATPCRMLADEDGKGNYRIPFVICIDAYFSETVPYADLVLPDTTYLERYDCISLLDRPIGSAHGPADAIRVPVLKPDRDVRPFPDVLIDLAGRLGLPHFVNADGKPRYNSYADYIVHHERRPGVGPLAGFRGDGRNANRPRGTKPGPAAPLRRERQLLAPPSAGGTALLQAFQSRLLARRKVNGSDRPRRKNHSAALLRDPAEIPSRCRRSW